MSEHAPYIIIALLAFLGTIPALLLPETQGKHLPTTIHDMENFAKIEGFFWMPLRQLNLKETTVNSKNGKASVTLTAEIEAMKDCTNRLEKRKKERQEKSKIEG